MEKMATDRNALENMSDGVVTIDLAGEIVTFNEAAERILGLAREEALGKKFGEVFLLRRESDEAEPDRHRRRLRRICRYPRQGRQLQEGARTSASA